ncbi:MAG: DUF4255 domain-containing protein [Lewinellaceae bacterium]|nr:DUF4255 domain-containing protein [Lewinellaceae bacterium]
MGSTLIKIIIEQINQYIRSVEEHSAQDFTGVAVKLGNIATAKFAGGDNVQLTNKVVVTLVNVDEESTLKNQTNSRLQNGQYIALQPVVHVNLYLLFTANFDEYETAINYLFRVLEFFQGKRVFKFKNAPVSGVNAKALEQAGEVELAAELHTLSFEQVNDLWGSLGGKQMPFVLYRLRLVPVQMEQIIGREGIITEIDLNIDLSV